VNHDSKSSGKAWTRLLLGTAMGGFLVAAAGAWADVPKPSAPVQGDAAEVKKLIADAQTALKNGNSRLALIYLRNAVRAAPSNPDAHIQLGLVLLQTNDVAGAEREFRLAGKAGSPETTILPYVFQVMLVRGEDQQLLDEFPDPGASKSPAAADILKGRAFALQHLGRAPEALDAVERSLKLRRDGQGLLARARLSLLQGDVNSARQFADEALSRSPGSLEIALFKLAVLKSARDGAAGLALSTQLLAKYPGSLEVQFGHVEMLLDQNQDAKAKAEIDAILARQPGLPGAIFYKALLRSRAGDARGAWDLALTLQKEALESSPGLALKVAQMAVDAGHQEAAANILGRVLGKDPQNQAARLRLATIYLDQDNATSALNTLGAARDSSDPEVMRLLARIYTRLDRADDAAKILKKLAAAAKDSPQELRRTSLANIQAGRVDLAIKDLSAAVSKDPTNPALVAQLVSALVRVQRFADALALTDKLGTDPRQRAAAALLRGDILAQKRDFSGAETAFNEAIRIEPGNRNALLARGSLYVLAQKYDPATRDLRAILSRNPKDFAALVLLADIAARQGRDADVRSNLAKAIAATPDDPGPRLTLARYLAGRGDLKGGLEQASNVVKLKPSNPAGLELQGAIQLRLGQKKEAAASFRRLVSLLPNAAGPRVLLGNALFLSGDRAGAVKAVDAAVALDPKSVSIKVSQISLQLAMGQADQAVSTAQAFRKANPGPDGDVLAADTLLRSKHADQAMDLLSKSFASKPTRPLLSRYVRLAAMQNQDKRADDALAAWLRKNPADIGARLEFADFYMSRKDMARAVTQYDAVLKREPNNVLALNNLGGLLQVSDPGRASVLLTKAEQLAPNSPDINDSLGWLKVQQKDVAAGTRYLRRAHDLRPKDGQISYHLVVALDANARRDEARALLKNLLASGVVFPEKQAALKLASQWR